MKVTTQIKNAEYGKFSDIYLSFSDKGIDRNVLLSFNLGQDFPFEKINDFYFL